MGDLNGELVFPFHVQQPPIDDVKYISIGLSNYDKIYVVGVIKEIIYYIYNI